MAIPPMAGFTVEHGLRDGAEVYEPQGGGDRLRQPPVARVGVEPGLPLVPVEKESTLDTVSSAFAALGLSYPLQAALLQAMGCGEDDTVDALVAAPQEEVNELIKNVAVGEEERAPTFFEKGALHSFFKKLRAALADPPSAPPASSTTPTPIVVTLPDTTNKLPLRDYLDQTITSCTFEKLSPQSLRNFEIVISPRPDPSLQGMLAQLTNRYRRFAIGSVAKQMVRGIRRSRNLQFGDRSMRGRSSCGNFMRMFCHGRGRGITNS